MRPAYFEDLYLTNYVDATSLSGKRLIRVSDERFSLTPTWPDRSRPRIVGHPQNYYTPTRRNESSIDSVYGAVLLMSLTVLLCSIVVFIVKKVSPHSYVIW